MRLCDVISSEPINMFYNPLEQETGQAVTDVDDQYRAWCRHHNCDPMVESSYGKFLIAMEQEMYAAAPHSLVAHSTINGGGADCPAAALYMGVENREVARQREDPRWKAVPLSENGYYHRLYDCLHGVRPDIVIDAGPDEEGTAVFVPQDMHHIVRDAAWGMPHVSASLRDVYAMTDDQRREAQELLARNRNLQN